MEEFEKKYNEVIRKIGIQKPVLKNPNNLTDQIISHVQNFELNKHINKTDFILILRPFLTVAATFLIGLYFYQQTEISMISKNSSINHITQTFQESTRNEININKVTNFRIDKTDISSSNSLKKNELHKNNLVFIFRMYREKMESESSYFNSKLSMHRYKFSQGRF
jgi:hypothetical protein